MSKWSKPKAGSRGYWPRKRAKRMYPVLKAAEGIGKQAKAEPIGFAGYKAGMAQAFVTFEKKGSPIHGKPVVKAVTVLDCPNLVVCGIKAYKKDPYGLKDVGLVWAEKLSRDLSRSTEIPKDGKKSRKISDFEKDAEGFAELRLLVHEQPRESASGKKTPEIFEIPLTGEIKGQMEYCKQKIGGQLKPEEVFKEGEPVDVVAVTTGKGFQGVVKRHGVKVRSRKNKAKMRHIGSLGPYHPNRVLPGVIPHPGQMGFHNRTEYNKRILKIGAGGLTPKGGWLDYGVLSGGFVVLQGSVPGPKKRLIMLRKASRPHKKEPAFKLDSVSLESQQGL